MTIQTFCPQCGAAVLPNAEFCGACGFRIRGGAGDVAVAQAEGGEYAGFWMRLLAFIIDAIILAIPNGLIEVAIDQVGFQIILRLLLGAAYYVGFWVANDGATPGKMALGMKVQQTDGGSVDVSRAFIRWIGYYVSAVILFIGFIMVAFTPKKQGLHDYMAGTVVVKTR